MCFLRQEPNLAPEILKSDKIDCQKPGAKLSIRELGIPNLDKPSQAEPKPSGSTKNEKAAFSSKQGIFENSRGGFVEDSSTKIAKTRVSIEQETLFKGSNFPMLSFHGPELNK